MSDNNPQQTRPQIPIQMRPEVAGGSYTNNMIVAHTREEFVMDFLSVFPTGGVVNARVITSPGHMKRLVHALTENLRKYEATFGEVHEATEPVVQ